MTPETKTLSKKADSKGRVTLGKEFAGYTFIFKIDTETKEITLSPAQVIAEHEMWLHKNPAALATVLQGLADARAGNFVKGPDLDHAKKFADLLKESEE
ncbi:hypothetical protein H8D29_02830 [PVC group bacterium]|nr:hypothetical protein [PVC group bacterium]